MEKLTVELAKKEVQYIDSIKYDDEVAHSREDDLYSLFIECVSENMYETIEEMQQIAKEILKTNDIDFARWCA